MHESLRLWSILNAMKWNHLPVSGGLYDQHPGFLDDIEIIFRAQGDQRQKDQEKQERNMKQKKGRRR